MKIDKISVVLIIEIRERIQKKKKKITIKKLRKWSQTSFLLSHPLSRWLVFNKLPHRIKLSLTSHVALHTCYTVEWEKERIDQNNIVIIKVIKKKLQKQIEDNRKQKAELFFFYFLRE